MAGSRAGLGGTFYVTLIVLGLAVLVGLIFWMMLAGGGIRHSPQQRSAAGPAVAALKSASAVYHARG
jgi:hypothetical protein